VKGAGKSMKNDISLKRNFKDCGKYNFKFVVMMAALMLVVSGAQAKTNVAEKIQQLKENTEASNANLHQYEGNLKVVGENLAETDKALKTLERQKLALAKQTEATQKGKIGVDAAKKQLEGYMLTERQKIEAEKKQIEELKKSLVQLEANQKKREESLVKYQEKIQKVDRELASWSERNQSIVELEKAMKAKEAEAKADQKKLAEKKATYEQEVGKWRKQAKTSERAYAAFSKIKD
jgi:chromosome segregation ATPase